MKICILSSINFGDPEKDGDDLYLQAFADPESFEKNIIIQYSNAEEDIKIDDYISVEGVVKGAYS